MVADSRRVLCISLHDVAPATLNECMDTLAFLDGLGLGPVALLVVPDYHGLGRADRDDRFAMFIESRILRGDEIVLHGYRHMAPAAAGPHGIRKWLTHRFRESADEFSQLDFLAARTRILRGLVVLRSAGWNPTGFVPSEQQLSTHVLNALEESPLQYCASGDYITILRSGHRIPAPSLNFGTDSGWRRAVSLLWNPSPLEQQSTSRVVRASLHPADLMHPEIEANWRRLPSQIDDRTIVTEARLIPPQFARTTSGPDRLRIVA
jgi:uncharacterized protein